MSKSIRSVGAWFWLCRVGEYLAISRRLAEQNPSNAGWQRELAVALVKFARMDLRIRGYAETLPLYEEASRIFSDLVENWIVP